MASLTDRLWHHRLPNNRALFQNPESRVSKIPELITRPTENYFTGRDKSMLWKGHSYYVPSGQRKWMALHERQRAPGYQRPDEIEFQREDKWVHHMTERDRPRGWNRTGAKGFSLSRHPELKLDGYCVNPFNLHRAGNRPRFMESIKPEYPEWRGPPGYYGYYHEELDATRRGGTYQYPRHPVVLQNDEDLLKAEYRLTHPYFEEVKPKDYNVELERSLTSGPPRYTNKMYDMPPIDKMTSYIH